MLHDSPAPAAHPRYQPLIALFTAVAAGIVFDRYVPLPFVLWWWLAAILLVVWNVLRRMNRGAASMAALMLSTAALGAAWHHAHWNLFAPDDIGRFANIEQQPVCIEVIAASEPRRAPAPANDPLRAIPLGDRDQLDVEVVAIRDGRKWRPVSGQSTLRVEGHLLGVHAGDRLQVFGALARPQPAMNPGAFDFELHHRAERRLCLVRTNYPDAVTVLAPADSWSLARAFGSLRGAGEHMLGQRLGGRTAALAAAVLLGERAALNSKRAEPFVTTGTIHLLVVSGLHVAIVASLLVFAMQMGFLPRRASLVVVMALVLFYALLTGGRPPVLRAAAVIVICTLAVHQGRRVIRFNALAAAALIVVTLNPADLFRVGPQLSFIAVGALIASANYWARYSQHNYDPLKHLIERSRPWPRRAGRSLWRGYWRLTLAGVGVWLLTEPLLMYRFHLLAPATMVLSPILWFPLALALLSGLGVLLFGWLIPPLGSLFGWICDLNLHAIQSVVEFVHHTPGSYRWVTGPGLWWLLVFYGGVAIAAAFPRFRPPLRWCVAISAGWIAVGIGVSFWPKDDAVRCTFAAMGHGSSVIVELPEGKTLLYDAGQLGSPEWGIEAISHCLWSRGITHLDAIVLSHADVDHYNCVPGLFERFSVGGVYVSPMMFEERTEALALLREAIETTATPLFEVWHGDRLQAGEHVEIQVLHPPQTGVLGSDNANSIVLTVDHNGRRILLPGDLETPGLEHVTAERPLDCDVTMAPHHGSRRSDPPGFAAWCTPEWLIVSGGLGRDISEVRAAYAQAGARVLHTAYDGAITATIDEEELTVETWLPP